MVSIVKEHTVWWEVQVSKLYDIAIYMGAVEREAEEHLMQIISLGIERWLNIEEGFVEEVPELSFWVGVGVSLGRNEGCGSGKVFQRVRLLSFESCLSLSYCFT